MSSDVRHYFVDEHGDGTLFDRKGRVIVGTEGCSLHFALGVLDVPDPAGLTAALADLRSRLLADPYFRGVESLKPNEARLPSLFMPRTTPEIRMLVFQLLAQQDVRFQAVVRDKRSIVTQVRNLNDRSDRYHYTPNRLYDEMVKRLFKNRLHKADGVPYRSCFASRGSKDRTAALGRRCSKRCPIKLSECLGHRRERPD